MNSGNMGKFIPCLLIGGHLYLYSICLQWDWVVLESEFQIGAHTEGLLGFQN